MKQRTSVYTRQEVAQDKPRNCALAGPGGPCRVSRGPLWSALITERLRIPTITEENAIGYVQVVLRLGTTRYCGQEGRGIANRGIQWRDNNVKRDTVTLQTRNNRASENRQEEVTISRTDSPRKPILSWSIIEQIQHHLPVLGRDLEIFLLDLGFVLDLDADFRLTLPRSLAFSASRRAILARKSPLAALSSSSSSESGNVSSIFLRFLPAVVEEELPRGAGPGAGEPEAEGSRSSAGGRGCGPSSADQATQASRMGSAGPRGRRTTEITYAL